MLELKINEKDISRDPFEIMTWGDRELAMALFASKPVGEGEKRMNSRLRILIGEEKAVLARIRGEEAALQKARAKVHTLGGLLKEFCRQFALAGRRVHLPCGRQGLHRAGGDPAAEVKMFYLHYCTYKIKTSDFGGFDFVRCRGRRLLLPRCSPVRFCERGHICSSISDSVAAYEEIMRRRSVIAHRQGQRESPI